MIVFLWFMTSILIAYGMAVTLVEKGDEWPVRRLRIRSQLIVRKIHWKLPKLFKCTVCCSFWMALISDLFLFIISGWEYIPMWPFTGFAALGFTWTMIQFMNALDS